jgi:predicted Rossmann fold flavoprotein
MTMTNDFDILIIGGGASGFISAITAKEHNSNLKIAILDRLPRVLKKVLATGNGTCNLSNRDLDLKHYYGDLDFIKSVMAQFDLDKTLQFFERIGIITETDDEGRIYPVSRCASAVVDALRFKAEALGIDIICDCKVADIKKQDKFIVKAEDGQIYKSDKLILSAGGTASKNLGSDGSGYKLAEMLHHNRSKLFPAICPFKTDISKIKSLRGIRLDAIVKVLVGDNKVAEQSGELLFTEYGLSGNLIFKLSRRISENLKQNPVLSIDLLPKISLDDLTSSLFDLRADAGYLKLDEFLMGLLPKAVARMVVINSGTDFNNRIASSLTDLELEKISKSAKDFRIIPKEPLSFEKAQVTCGGLNTADFNPQTLQSKKIKNFYACGEILDVDGDCGGYNLQWAWSSGFVAGKNVAG